MRDPRIVGIRNAWHFESWSPVQALRERKHFVDSLRAQATPDSDLDGAAMIFAELVGNVVRHAGGPVHIDVVWRNDGHARLSVRDRGPGFAYLPAALDPYTDSGRGLFIVNALGEGLEVQQTEEGACVEVLLPVWRAPALA